jgi:hypothetical protein
VVLTHNLGSGAIAYHGQKVTLTCTVNIVTVVNRGIVITWRSGDYIGPGDVLQVTSKDSVGSTVHKSTTAVTLISTTQSNGMITVVTELQLMASAMYPNSRVSCQPNGRVRVICTFGKSDVE